MNGTTMIVLIVFISVGFGAIFDMYKKHLEFKEKTLAHNSESDEEKKQLKQQLAALTERVQVLEKIVTDKNYSLKEEIDQL